MNVLKVLGVFVLIIVGSFLGLRFMFLGRFTLPSTAEYERLARTGQGLAQAITDYQNDHGLLPESFNDLVPDYLKSIPPTGWSLRGAVLDHHAGVPHTAVLYSFIDKRWCVLGERGGRVLNLPAPIPARPQLSSDVLFTTRLTEYERRIARHPYDEGWYNSKISFVGLAKREGLLRKECNRAVGVFPNWWLPRMTLAELDGPDSPAGREFESWVEARGKYVTYWYLARFYRDKNRLDQAMQALQKASTMQFDAYPENSEWVGGELAFDAVQFTYEHRNFELAMKLCKQWESLGPSYGEKSWLAFEAAIEIAQAQFESAISHARLANAEGPRLWAGNLPELLRAAETHETNFVYRAGSLPSAWVLFTEPAL